MASMNFRELEQRNLTRKVLAEVQAERERQDARWGATAAGTFDARPDGVAPHIFVAKSAEAKAMVEEAKAAGALTWAHLLWEEFFEVLAEGDPDKMRKELVQVAAVAVSWIEAVDVRSKKG